MKVQTFFLFFLIFLVVAQGCSDKLPTESNEPSLPTANANALVFDNLALIQSLERSRRQDTVLTYITGSGLKLDGRPSEGSTWEYAFVRTNPTTIFSWFVFSDGHIQEPSGHPPAHFGLSHLDMKIVKDQQ
jgi:hypothetical protein